MGLLDSPFSYRKKRGLWILSLLSLMAVVIVMILIYHFSSENSSTSAQVSGGLSLVLVRFLARFYPGHIAESTLCDIALRLDTPVRKLAHFSEYMTLGICLQTHLWTLWQLDLRGMQSALSVKKLRALGLLLCALYACSDEIHQYFVPGRACRFYDVCIDTSGAFFGLFLFSLIFLRLLDVIFLKGYNDKN